MAIDYFNPPKKSVEKLDELYNDNQYLVMDQVLESNKSYQFVFQDLLDIMKYGFEDERIRKRIVKFKFHTTDKKFHKMQLNHLISNLIMWKPLMNMDKVDLLDDSYIFDFTKFNANSLLGYINNVLLPISDEDFASKNAMIDEIYHSIISISHAFCLLIGNGVSLYNIKRLEEQYPEVHSLMYDDIDESLPPKEIEDQLSDKIDRLIEIMINDIPSEVGMDNDFRSTFASGAGIKKPQMREFMLKIGLKADLSGNVIPVMNNGSFLVNGIPTPALLYINGLSGRKSLIAVKQGMGIPGAYSKKLCQATTSSGVLVQDNEMCDSIATVDYHINDDEFLSYLDGRYYIDAHGYMKCLDYQKDKHLIGKIVRFKSPATCCGKDGICKYCYGKLYDVNKDLFSVGALVGLKTSEPASQGVLSTKHSQNTNSSEIKFSDGFDELFEIDSSEVSLREDSDLDAELYIVLNDVVEEELDDKMYYYTNGFEIRDPNNETVYTIYEENDAKLYLNDQIAETYKKLRDKSTPIPLESLDDETTLFTIEVKNKELTEPIKIFNKLLNTNDHYGATNISELCQKFAEALISMGQKYDLVHCETIVRAFVRKKSNILEYPDFTRAGNLNDWQIVTLNNSLQYHPSALVSIPYGFLRKQMLSTELYEKHAPSHLDTLYASTLSDYL